MLLLHGGQDRTAPAAHSRRLADRCPTANRGCARRRGVSVLDAGAEALQWPAARRG